MSKTDAKIPITIEVFDSEDERQMPYLYEELANITDDRTPISKVGLSANGDAIYLFSSTQPGVNGSYVGKVPVWSVLQGILHAYDAAIAAPTEEESK